MPRIQIEPGGRSLADIEDTLEKAARAVTIAQDRDFADPVMQDAYNREMDTFMFLMDAMTEEIEALP